MTKHDPRVTAAAVALAQAQNIPWALVGKSQRYTFLADAAAALEAADCVTMPDKARFKAVRKRLLKVLMKYDPAGYPAPSKLNKWTRQLLEAADGLEATPALPAREPKPSGGVIGTVLEDAVKGDSVKVMLHPGYSDVTAAKRIADGPLPGPDRIPPLTGHPHNCP